MKNFLLVGVVSCVTACGGGSDESPSGGGTTDGLCAANEVSGPSLPGSEAVFTIVGEYGTRIVPGRVTGASENEIGLQAMCLPNDKPQGYMATFSFTSRSDLSVGGYDKDTPATDPDDAALGRGEVWSVIAYYDLSITAPFERMAGADPDEYNKAWRGIYGISTGPDAIEDFEFSITSLEPLQEPDRIFEFNPHGSGRIALQPIKSDMSADPEREPAVISVEF